MLLFGINLENYIIGGIPLNTEKLINEFQEITKKIDIYETERNTLLLKIKELKKENKKVLEKAEKANDRITKSVYRAMSAAYLYFIEEIESIFSFHIEKKEDIK